MIREAAVWLLPTELVLAGAMVGAGLLTIVGARRMARTLVGGTAAALVIHAAGAHLLAAAPLGLMLLAAPIIALIVVKAVVQALLGREVAGQVVGVWVVRLFDASFRALGRPFRGRR
jgi:hypothetical protein